MNSDHHDTRKLQRLPLTAKPQKRRWCALGNLGLVVTAFFELIVSVIAVVLLVLSQSNPWLIGAQHEPNWSWAIGSGRLKAWVAEPGQFSDDERWTSSWYRGLDGRPIRWDFSFHRGTTGGVVVIAIPLWAIACFGAGGGGLLLWIAQNNRR